MSNEKVVTASRMSFSSRPGRLRIDCRKLLNALCGISTPFGVPAFKGRWSDDHTFVIDVQFMGAGEQRKWTLSFDGERPTLHGKARDGHEVAVAAEPAVQH